MDGLAESSNCQQDPGQVLAHSVSPGGLHALRNAMQVVRAYTEIEMPPGPGCDAVKAGIVQMLQVIGTLEGLLGVTTCQPAPEEVLGAFYLLPRLCVHQLREKSLDCDLSRLGKPDPGLLKWELLQLATIWLIELITLCPKGKGRIAVELEGCQMTVAWQPPAGTLPFPLVTSGKEGLGRDLAKKLGLTTDVSQHRFGYQAVAEKAKETAT